MRLARCSACQQVPRAVFVAASGTYSESVLSMSRPAKAAGSPYTRIQANEWMLALLLAELGVDPIVIVKSIQRERKKLHEWIREATDDEALGGNEVFLTTRPALMSGAWASKDSAGILRFEKFRRHDWALKIPRHDSHPHPSGRASPKPTGPPTGLIAPPSPTGAQPARSTHHLDA